MMFGVHVIVQNQGPDAIHDLRVYVTGRTYNLGTIENNRHRSIVVEPTGDSHGNWNLLVVMVIRNTIQLTVTLDAAVEWQSAHRN